MSRRARRLPVRMTLELSTEAAANLDALVTALDVPSRSEAIRRAITIAELVVDHGGEVLARDPAGNLVRIRIT